MRSNVLLPALALLSVAAAAPGHTNPSAAPPAAPPAQPAAAPTSEQAPPQQEQTQQQQEQKEQQQEEAQQQQGKYESHSYAATCKVLEETQPWYLSNLLRFNSTTDGRDSHISFHFKDTSPGLELATECVRKAPHNISLIEDGTYYPCANSTVRFMFSDADKTINIARVHFDPCLGPKGYQTEDAFGHNTVTWSTWRTPKGIVSAMKSLEVNVTELIS